MVNTEKKEFSLVYVTSFIVIRVIIRPIRIHDKMKIKKNNINNILILIIQNVPDSHQEGYIPKVRPTRLSRMPDRPKF